MNMSLHVSYIIPHRDREGLFQYNLNSLKAQTNKDFEIIIIDSSQDSSKIKEIVTQYKKFLNIRLFFVDPKKCIYAHDGSIYGNNFCPALQQNIGVKKCDGDIIVLTSPEIVNASTNVSKIINKFKNRDSQFLLGWMDEMKKENIAPWINSGYNLNQLKSLCENNAKIGAWCKEHDWRPANYFLGVLLKKDFIHIGGIEESFMGGIAWEDDEFSRRCIDNDIKCSFEGGIGGVHLSHPRTYQCVGETAWEIDSINGKIFHQTYNLVANQNHEWGSFETIIGEY